MKNTVGHFIKEGGYEYLLYFRKSEGWDLIKVRAERNRLCKEYEEQGIRSSGHCRKGGRIPSENLTLDN